MKRKIFLWFLSIVLLTPLLTVKVFANSPPSNTVGPQPYTGTELLVYIIFALGGMVLTVIVEAFAVRMLRSYGNFSTLVVVTNICSQIVMHGVNLCLSPYLYHHKLLLLVILELIVYATEFFVYRRKMRSLPAKKVLIYTCVANTLSLVTGIAGYLYMFYTV